MSDDTIPCPQCGGPAMWDEETDQIIAARPDGEVAVPRELLAVHDWIVHNPYFGDWDEWQPIYDKLPVQTRTLLAHVHGRHDASELPYLHCLLCEVFDSRAVLSDTTKENER